MARIDRLLQLLQQLRQHRRPVSAETLAARLGVSVRTIYRDIATLTAQGAVIDGEAGVGFVLRPGFTLPPLMFTVEEAEAIALGANWVARRTDAAFARAAASALAKVTNVVPDDLRGRLEQAAMLPGGGPGDGAIDGADLSLVRAAIRSERKLGIVYRDLAGATTERTVWPIALSVFDQVQLLAAWCELRQGFRHFRTDRITGVTPSEERLPRRRNALLREWRRGEGVPEPL
ncbi:MAG TPA: YafY family protein [Reyranellaceae bacterium]|nr:YafY family protein [Reyranellaceae bacterium]